MKEDCTGSQGLQWTALLKEEGEEEKKKTYALRCHRQLVNLEKFF